MQSACEALRTDDRIAATSILKLMDRSVHEDVATWKELRGSVNSMIIVSTIQDIIARTKDRFGLPKPVACYEQNRGRVSIAVVCIVESVRSSVFGKAACRECVRNGCGRVLKYSFVPPFEELLGTCGSTPLAIDDKRLQKSRGSETSHRWDALWTAKVARWCETRSHLGLPSEVHLNYAVCDGPWVVRHILAVDKNPREGCAEGCLRAREREATSMQAINKGPVYLMRGAKTLV